MPITPSIGTPIRQMSAVTLSRYAQIIDKDECSFWGVYNAPGQDPEDCGYIWLKRDRKMIGKYLAEAQEEIENRTRYPLSPKWITGLTTNQRFENILLTDVQDYRTPLLARWGRVMEAGVYLETTVEDVIPVANPNADPYVFTATLAVATGASIEEIRTYHGNTDDEVMPSEVTIDGGNLVTVKIPRCRLVKPDLSNNDTTGVDYQVVANFTDKIKITHARTDPSTQANIVKHICDSSCAVSCSESTQTACIVIKESEIGHIVVRPATFVGGQWSSSGISCRTGNRVRLNYRAGTYYLSKQAKDAIVRLAHAKMPDEPCDCAQGQRMWKRDRNIPSVLTSERLNCPFGLNDGAWIAWEFASDMKNITMTVF